MKLRTNAKVNLFLRILGERTDGYHEIETIFHSVSLADDIEIVPTDSGDVEVEMVYADGLTGEIPDPMKNLVHIAGLSLIDAGASNDGVLIRLVKRIPAGAGLGGGSGNAAGALVALSRYWGFDIAPADLLDRAAAIGSDVPYCIEGGTALASGRGENLTRLPPPAPMWFVLGISDIPLPTRDVYFRLSPARGRIQRRSIRKHRSSTLTAEILAGRRTRTILRPGTSSIRTCRLIRSAGGSRIPSSGSS